MSHLGNPLRNDEPLHPLVSQVLHYIQAKQLFHRGPVVVAVSGGRDSLVLLHILVQLQQRLDISLHVASLDHGLRGAAGAQDVQFVKRIAAQWGLPCHTRQADVQPYAARHHLGIEAAARQVRYSFLLEVAREIGALQIATGHHANDQAETVLLHIIRGTGLGGLRGMLPRTAFDSLGLLQLPDDAAAFRLVRPLLAIPQAELQTYLRDVVQLTPCEDDTNLDQRYARNRLRYEVLPILAEFNSNIVQAFVQLTSMVDQAYEDLMDNFPRLDLDGSLSYQEFMSLSRTQQGLVVHHLAQAVPQGSNKWDYVAITQLVETLCTATHDFSTPDVRLLGDRLYLFNATAPYPDNVPWLPAHASYLLNFNESFTMPKDWMLSFPPVGTTIPTLDSLEAVLCVPPNAALKLRAPQVGDRMHMAGLQGKRQKLSDVFINAKVPREWRAHVPLVCVNDQIAWAILPTADGFRSRIAAAFDPTYTTALADVVKIRLCYMHANSAIMNRGFLA